MHFSPIDVPCIMVFPPHNKLPFINKTLAVKKVQGTDVPHCPKTITNLQIKTGSVTPGADATLYVWLLFTYFWPRNLHLHLLNSENYISFGTVCLLWFLIKIHDLKETYPDRYIGDWNLFINIKM